MRRPYMAMRQVRDPNLFGTSSKVRVELELADTPNLAAQTEKLMIQTLVKLPLPAGAQTAQLAALIHVRDLLDAQIRAMQSP